MKAYADTGLLASLFLPEASTAAAQKALAGLREPLPLIPLALLEMRNALNLAIVRNRITVPERDALLRQFNRQIENGFFLETNIPAADLHKEACRLSDRHTAKLEARSLDLLHLAAAKLLGAQVFYSFDHRQRKAAAAEGLKVKPRAGGVTNRVEAVGSRVLTRNQMTAAFAQDAENRDDSGQIC